MKIDTFTDLNGHSNACFGRCQHSSRNPRTGVVTYPATREYLAARTRITSVSVETPEGACCYMCGVANVGQFPLQFCTTVSMTDGVETGRRTLCAPCVRAKYL